jgi:phosphate transport system protein
MDELHRQVFSQLLSDDWDEGVEAAIDATLLSRYYERFADHAVSVAERVVYLVTGEYDAEGSGVERSTAGAAQVGVPRDGELSRD